MIALQNPTDSHGDRQLAATDNEQTDLVTQFVRQHQTGLCRFLRLCGAGPNAEELAQEAFLVAIRRGLTTEHAARAGSFLRQTAKHLWLRQRRDDRRQKTREAEIAEHLWQKHVSPDHDQGDHWLEALTQCLEQLPGRSRTALDRTYRDGLGRAELGAELGISEHGVRSLLQRLRATLRTCIEARRTR